MKSFHKARDENVHIYAYNFWRLSVEIGLHGDADR